MLRPAPPTTPATALATTPAKRTTPPRRVLALALGVLSPGLAGPLAAAPQALDTVLQRADAPPARALLRELTRTTRLAGTSGSAFGAEIVTRLLEEAGFDVEVDERLVLLSLPRRLELAVYDDDFAERAHIERVHVFDPDAVPAGDVPAYSAWTASGDVRAEVVDVGYGLAADYARLDANGIDVRGLIVLARYGRAYRGVKVDLATEHGALGVLLFNDPADDGAERGPTWPAGPWKPDWEAQRGSISPMGRSPGDPSTPGWASPAPAADGSDAAATRRLTGDALAAQLPTILCLPIGARDALAIRARLASRRLRDTNGESADERVGPGPVEVRMRLDVPRTLHTIRNVIGTLEGQGPGLVLAGNHRDAWVRGAHDAGSGTVALLRAGQRLADKARAGWRPKSAIRLAFWDAEEFGLIGSTEWGEAHAALLRERLIAYVNADAAVSGTHLRRVAGTPGLLGTLRAALERVPAGPDAMRGADEDVSSLWDEWSATAHKTAREPSLALLGSGSDFTVFLHHLNLPVLDISLSGNGGGQYHTTFDDLTMVERHIDPGFVGHELAGQLLFELLLELSERGRSAFDASEAATTLAALVRRAGEENGEDREAWLGRERAERLAAAFDRAAATDGLPSDFYARIGASDGVGGSTWFKNRMWTPGLETGYAPETLPTLRSAAARDARALDAEIDDLIRVLDDLTPDAPAANLGSSD